MALNGTAYVIEWNLGGGDSLWLHSLPKTAIMYYYIRHQVHANTVCVCSNITIHITNSIVMRIIVVHYDTRNLYGISEDLSAYRIKMH